MFTLSPGELRVRGPRVLRTLLLASAVVLGFFVLGWLYAVLLTVFAGVLLGVFLNGLARGVIRWTRWPYRPVVASLVILLLVAIALCIWLVGPALATQLEQLVAQIPAALRLLREGASTIPFVRSLVGPGTSVGSVGSLVGAAASAVRMSVEAIAGIVIAIVIGIYAAVDPGVYERGLLHLVPIPRRPRGAQIVHRTTTILMRWTVGRVVVMIAVGVLTGVGLWISGVPLAFALAILAGAMTFVPYLGVLISLVPALLVALTKSPLSMVWVVVTFAVAHGVEGYVLSPLIAKRTVEFPPALTIGVQLLLGAAWGVLGFTFATPIAVVATILVRMLYVEDMLGDRSAGPSPASGASPEARPTEVASVDVPDPARGGGGS